MMTAGVSAWRGSHARLPAVIESPYKGETGFRRVLNATRNSLAGLVEAVRHEDAFRQELILAAIFLPLAFWVGDTALERAMLIGTVLLVLIVELLNSAIEATVDRISFENHRLAKRAKDIGSAAVMLALFNAAVVWVLILASKT
jgi:diacylglycerol kinase (ATP)